MKLCGKCQITKPLDHFHSNARRPDGKMPYCKTCNGQKVAEWYKANRKKARAYGRAWYKENKKKALDSNLRRRYGITIEEFDKLNKQQKGLCAICGRLRKLGVDHNHETGDVRELLCSTCNQGIGFLEENEVILQAALDYVRRHRRDQ